MYVLLPLPLADRWTIVTHSDLLTHLSNVFNSIVPTQVHTTHKLNHESSSTTPTCDWYLGKLVELKINFVTESEIKNLN